MTEHLVAMLFGAAGGLITHGLHIAWKIRRGNKVNSGKIDLTYKKKP